MTIVGSIAPRLTEPGSGIAITTAQIGTAAAVYVAGACVGALFFGQLTDRFGRKKLFLITLGLYIAATLATAASWTAWFFFLCRFLTGAGIGGEYSAINSAIDELIPARVRGRVDLIINGSYWVGAAAGAAVAILLLNKALFAASVGWRLAFLLGAILGLGVLVRPPQRAREPALAVHPRARGRGRADRPPIEQDVERETDEQLDEPKQTITVRQREKIPFREIAKTAFQRYPRRAILGLALFIGQAFLYNGVTFNLGMLYTTFYGVSRASSRSSSSSSRSGTSSARSCSGGSSTPSAASR